MATTQSSTGVSPMAQPPPDFHLPIPMRFILTSLLLTLATAAGALTTGQIEVRVYNGTGFTSTYVTMSNGQVIGKTAGVPAAITPFDGVFGSLTSKPTTLSGYGISDAQATAGTLALAGFGSITGTLAAANGGTGQTSLQAGINALLAASGALSQGDLFYFNGTNIVRLAAGTDGQYLKTQGAGANPTWGTVSSGLTIGSTAVSGAASGDILISDGSELQKLTPGSGVSSALANTVNAASGLLTYDLIGTSGSKVPLLNAANTFSGDQTIGTFRIRDGYTYSGNVYESGSAYIGNDAYGGSLRATGYFQTDSAMSAQNGFQSKFNSGRLLFEAGYGTIYGANGIMRVVNGTTAQRLGVFNTYTSDTNFETGVFDWQTTSNTLRIGSEVGSGGGTARDVQLVRGGSVKVSLTSSGFQVGTAGTGIAQIKRYSVTLVAGTATVSDSDITANTQVIMSVLTPGGTVGDLDFDLAAGSSFTANSSSATDTSTIICTVIIYP